MPWIHSEQCTGCTVCMQNCPADAIGIENHILVIDPSVCIRCGICHDICPQNAVRHDKEKVPENVEQNIRQFIDLQQHPYYADHPEKLAGLTRRMINYYSCLEETVRRTLVELRCIETDLRNNPEA
jgi:ferredoxin